jgi:hypothetical protein
VRDLGVRFDFGKDHNGRFWAHLNYTKERVIVQSSGRTLEAAVAELAFTLRTIHDADSPG